MRLWTQSPLLWGIHVAGGDKSTVHTLEDLDADSVRLALYGVDTHMPLKHELSQYQVLKTRKVALGSSNQKLRNLRGKSSSCKTCVIRYWATYPDFQKFAQPGKRGRAI